jgi:hypothetical protein
LWQSGRGRAGRAGRLAFTIGRFGKKAEKPLGKIFAKMPFWGLFFAMLRLGQSDEAHRTSVEVSAQYFKLKYFVFLERWRRFQTAESTISSAVAWIDIVIPASRARSSV